MPCWISMTPYIRSRSDRHVIRIALMDCGATSRALSQEFGLFARQQVSARTVRQRLLQHGLSARRLWLRFPLTLYHRQERLQWFRLQHQDCCIRVLWHRGERTLAAYIRHRHTGPSPGMIVWGAIRYSSRSPLVRIDGPLNSACYISGVLRLVALLFIRVLRNPTFKQDNA
ncbi:uncharacterized protein TNCV_1255141 [Trichonephila clavipes]|nr:uncharacterized protein TNCV_1255141 [Trichonephila clavipes]